MRVFAQADPAQSRLDRTRRTQGVAGQWFGRADCNLAAKHLLDRQAFHGVVVPGRGAVQVDVIHRSCVPAGTGKCLLDRRNGAGGRRIRGRHVVGIGGFTPASQNHRPQLAGHKEQARALADVDAAAVDRERIAALGRDCLQGRKAGHGKAAQ